MPPPNPRHSSDLWQSVYRELRGLARQFLATERRDHTLQPTALVHEAFLRLHGDRGLSRHDRAEFCRAAAAAMRRILVDHARQRLRRKRGHHDAQRVELEADLLAAPADARQLLDVEQALGELERISARRAEICRLRFFAGLTEQEVAEILDVSRRTVQYEFRSARAWLKRTLHDGEAARQALEELER